MKTIVLDAGHGQFGNAHTCSEGFYEGTQNFILAGYLKEQLEALGYRVLLTRNDITDDPSLEERGKLAGENNADMFLSIHSNAPPSSYEHDVYISCRGVNTYYSLKSPDDKEFAQKLTSALAECMNTKDRGVQTREYPDQPGVDYYGVIRNSVASGCRHAFIVEHGFHTNPEDSAFLESSECLAKLAVAEAKIISEYLGE